MSDTQGGAGMFADATSVGEVVGRAMGAASTCWEETPKGVFDSTQAKEVFDEAIGRILELITPRVVRDLDEARALPVGSVLKGPLGQGGGITQPGRVQFVGEYDSGEITEDSLPMVVLERGDEG